MLEHQRQDTHTVDREVLRRIPDDSLSFVGCHAFFTFDLLVAVPIDNGRPRPNIDMRRLASCAKVVSAQVFLYIGRIHNLARLILVAVRSRKAERIVVGTRAAGVKSASRVAAVRSGIVPRGVIVWSAVEGDSAVFDVRDPRALHMGKIHVWSPEAIAGAQEKSHDSDEKGDIGG